MQDNMNLKDRLERKLQLLLGSQRDWLAIYADWCADNNVTSTTDACDDHNISIFVRQQRERKAA